MERTPESIEADMGRLDVLKCSAEKSREQGEHHLAGALEDIARTLDDRTTQLILILARLDLEAQERGEGTVFPCAAYRESIRRSLA